MKNLLLIVAVIGLAAYAGQDLIVNTARLDGFIFGNKSGGTDTFIIAENDGEFQIKNVKDPVDLLDAVNYQTLLAGGGAGLDSIPFNPLSGDLEAYFAGVNFYTANLDNRYVRIQDSTEISPDNYVNWPSLNDSLNYIDSVIATNLAPNIIVISLPNAGTVLSRITAAVAGVDYPSDWTLSPGTSPVDLDIQHNRGQYVHSVTIWSNPSGTERQQLYDAAAYSGIICNDNNNLRVQSLSLVPTRLYISIEFTP